VLCHFLFRVVIYFLEKGKHLYQEVNGVIKRKDGLSKRGKKMTHGKETVPATCQSGKGPTCALPPTWAGGFPKLVLDAAYRPRFVPPKDHHKISVITLRSIHIPSEHLLLLLLPRYRQALLCFRLPPVVSWSFLVGRGESLFRRMNSA
jgi:hypothetical protein